MPGAIPGVAASRQPQAILRDAVGVVPARCDHPQSAVRVIPAQRDGDDSLGLGRKTLPQDSVEVAGTPSRVPEASPAAGPTGSAQAPAPSRLFSKELAMSLGLTRRDENGLGSTGAIVALRRAFRNPFRVLGMLGAFLG
jgi:hypothetical protein